MEEEVIVDVVAEEATPEVAEVTPEVAEEVAVEGVAPEVVSEEVA